MVMFDYEVFVLKAKAVEGLPACTIGRGGVHALNHELFDYTMKL
jgi:hypothetical protein